MGLKDGDGMANSVDSDQTALIWVYIVCPDLSVRKFRSSRVQLRKCIVIHSEFSCSMFLLQSDLAVHKKKITEVESWIKVHTSSFRKVTTVKIIIKKMDTILKFEQCGFTIQCPVDAKKCKKNS